MVKGTAASSPVAPALTQNDVIWQEPLAQITVPAGAENLNSAMLTNVRGFSAGRHNHTITSGMIASGAVTGAKIAEETIAWNRLAPGAVVDTRIADGAVKTNKLADGAVTQNKIGGSIF